jgi:hypothetical protein
MISRTCLCSKPISIRVFGEGDSFALAAGQGAGSLLEMVDIQLAEDLFDLGVKIPGIQFIEPDDGVGDLIDVFCVAGRLIGLDGVDDGMVVVEDIVQDGLLFDKDGLLFEEGYRNVLVDPYGAVCRPFPYRKVSGAGWISRCRCGRPGRSCRLLLYER